MEAIQQAGAHLASKEGQAGLLRVSSAIDCLSISSPGTLMTASNFRIREGNPLPRGATWDGKGTNFALFSEHATRVDVCIFDDSGRREEAPRVDHGLGCCLEQLCRNAHDSESARRCELVDRHLRPGTDRADAGLPVELRTRPAAGPHRIAEPSRRTRQPLPAPSWRSGSVPARCMRSSRSRQWSGLLGPDDRLLASSGACCLYWAAMWSDH